MAKKKRSNYKQSTAPVIAGAKPISISVDEANYNGYEPVWTDENLSEENRQSKMAAGFNWYNYHCDSKDSQAFLVEYLNLNNRPKDAILVKRAKDHAFPNAIGWLARMTAMGWELTKEESKKIELSIKEATKNLLKEKEVKKEDESQKKKVNIQDRMREKALEVGGLIEGMLDDYIAAGAPTKHNYSPIGELKASNILPAHANEEVKHWENVLNEYVAVQTGKDKELVEAYNYISKKQLKNIIKFVEKIIADYHGYVAYKKAIKTPRKRKVKTPAELACKLKYLAEYKELNLKSEKPSRIVGSKEVFAYDVKKRKLMYFIADEYANELSIKNSTITGFDVNKSIQKTIRKPNEFFKGFMAASRPNTRKLFTQVKSVETKMSGRFNNNIVILKAW